MLVRCASTNLEVPSPANGSVLPPKFLHITEIRGSRSESSDCFQKIRTAAAAESNNQNFFHKTRSYDRDELIQAIPPSLVNPNSRSNQHMITRAPSEFDEEILEIMGDCVQDRQDPPQTHSIHDLLEQYRQMELEGTLSDEDIDVDHEIDSINRHPGVQFDLNPRTEYFKREEESKRKRCSAPDPISMISGDLYKHLPKKTKILSCRLIFLCSTFTSSRRNTPRSLRP